VIACTVTRRAAQATGVGVRILDPDDLFPLESGLHTLAVRGLIGSHRAARAAPRPVEASAMSVPSVSRHFSPSASRIGMLLRLCVVIARISAHGLLFNRPHRLMPPSVQLGGAGFFVASVLFFVAAVVRHCLVEGSTFGAVLGALVLAYGVLLLVSVANRATELTLCLSICAGIDAIASALALATLIDLGDPATRTWLLAWGLAAGFVALLQLHIPRLHRPPDHAG
jgi:hypothetical protein